MLPPSVAFPEDKTLILPAQQLNCAIIPPLKRKVATLAAEHG